METRHYGASGPIVSRLAYGAMGIVQDPELRNGIAPSLLHALDRGVTLIDTARVYPDSEAIIARTLTEWSGPAPVISTKLRSMNPAGFRTGCPVSQCYPDMSIRRSLDESLQALDVERIDIVHLHQWHYHWTHDLEWLETLTDLKREGKIGQVAISAQDHEHDALLELVSSGKIDGVQTIVNLFESRPYNALLPLAAERGTGVIARCVLDSGGLSGALTDSDFASRAFLKHAPVELYRQKLSDLLREFVPLVAPDLATLALRFAISHPAITALTVGMQTKAQVDSAVAAIDQGALPNEVVDRIRRRHVWTKNFYELLG